MIKLSAEQKLIQDEARKFATTELLPIAEELETKATFPVNIIKKLAEIGFLGIMIPEKYGGAELDPFSYCLIIEEIAKACPSIGLILTAHNGAVAYTVLKYARESQKDKWLPKLANGEIIGAFASTDENMIGTTIHKDNGSYILSGDKNFVVNGEVAELFVICGTQENKETASLVEKKDIELIEKEDSIGMRASGIWKLKLNNVKVDDEQILGHSEVIESAISFGGLGLAAISVGIGERILEEAIKYGKQRKQFGKFIADFPLVQEMLVDIKTSIAQAKLLVYSAGMGHSNPNMAKLSAGNAGVLAGIKGIQVHGGYGYIKDYPVERFFRDAKVAQILYGSPAYQKNKIAQAILK